MAIGSPAAEPSGYVPAALVTPDGNEVITSTVQDDHQWYGRDTVVAEFVELSAHTGKPVGVLRTVTQRFVSQGTDAALLDQECNVVSLGTPPSMCSCNVSAWLRQARWQPVHAAAWLPQPVK